MRNLFLKIKKKYFRLFCLSPKLLSTLIFMPFLYIVGWILATPLLLIGLGKVNLSLTGTIFTFLLFIFSLPKWFQIRWGINNTWGLLGINKINRNRNLIFPFIKGFLLSIVLIFLIIIPLIGTQWASWLGKISPEIFINAIILIIGVGFAEELIFRGWLLEELKNQFGLKKAIIAQASIFSIVHIGFDLPVWQMTSILSGLFLLGILLSIVRLKDKNSLWGCIGLHGGLVGIWFIVNNGLLDISKDYPKWIFGPGNPLGGILGIFIMLVFCFFYLKSYKKRTQIFRE